MSGTPKPLLPCDCLLSLRSDDGKTCARCKRPLRDIDGLLRPAPVQIKR